MDRSDVMSETSDDFEDELPPLEIDDAFDVRKHNTHFL